MPQKTSQPKNVETFTYEDASRKNIPTAEYQSVMEKGDQSSVRVAYERRNRDLDPQLVWRGKDEQDWSDLVVHAPPLYIQEKVHPKVLIDDLLRQTALHSSLSTSHSNQAYQPDLFSDFNGLPDENAKTEFYQHDANWTNRMILGDSLQVMASLAEREGLQGQVQCIYLDPPYGIKFNSNFQWSTTSRDVKDGNTEHITREPEQVKAFRDTWRDGIHSYLTYLRDRLTVARDLLHESGSIFVQIGDENVHRVRALMDEVFGEDNFAGLISFLKTSSQSTGGVQSIVDYVIFYAKNRECQKIRHLLRRKEPGEKGAKQYVCAFSEELSEMRRMTADEVAGSVPLPPGWRIGRPGPSTSQGHQEGRSGIYTFRDRIYKPSAGRHWSYAPQVGGELDKLARIGRLREAGKGLATVLLADDNPSTDLDNIWLDTGTGSFTEDQIYVVQTGNKVVQRCLLMATDPGDLVLDPTCGSGTTAYVAEQWGRRWITIDTSRVALALARARIMGARYPFYLLADSKEGQQKEAEVTRTAPSSQPTHGNIRHGFVYERVPHITLGSIAKNAEIDVIWEKFQEKIGPLLEQLSEVISGQCRVDSKDGKKGKVAAKPPATSHQPPSTSHSLAEWQVPRDFANYPLATHSLFTSFWEARIARQKEIDASIAAKADSEFLYDKPYEDKKTVRVAGPFTVESLSPHRTLAVNYDDELIDPRAAGRVESGQCIVESKGGKVSSLTTSHKTLATGGTAAAADFAQMVIDNLQTSGVQQAHKEDKITFSSVTPWPGHYICAEGRYQVDSDECIVDSKGGEKDGKLATNHSPLTTSPATNHSSLSTDSSTELRAGIFVGPEFGTVSRPDLVAAAREAGDADFDVLIACAFNYEAHASEFDRLGRIPILKARMNADLHMADDLKNTGKGNLFVIFGEPDIEVASEEWLVDSQGQRIAPYEIFKLVSGIDRLAEINRLGREDLRNYAELSCRREIWDYLSDAAGGDIDSGKHSRGASASDDRGVSTVAWHCAGLSGRTGDIRDLVAKVGPDKRNGLRELVDRLRGNKQDAARSHALTIHSPLTTSHYSQVTVLGVDVFHPQTGEVRSDGPEGIACWFIDTDYNEESFFVRHAYFLGQNDPYKSLKTTLKAEIDEEAWETLHSDTSRPFDKPKGGRIAVKVINHLGDEVMKVFKV